MPPNFFTFATHVCDSLSRLGFATPLATPDRVTNYDSRLPSCNTPTDGRTVLTPQCHLPSVPTLTLIKKQFFWHLLPDLASLSSYCPSSCPPPLMALCLLTPPLSPYLLQRPLLPPARAPANIPTFFTPSAPSSIPPVWEHIIDVLMKLPPLLQRDRT